MAKTVLSVCWNSPKLSVLQMCNMSLGLSKIKKHHSLRVPERYEKCLQGSSSMKVKFLPTPHRVPKRYDKCLQVSSSMKVKFLPTPPIVPERYDKCLHVSSSLKEKSLPTTHIQSKQCGKRLTKEKTERITE